jgi:hypothetical protein
MFRGLVYIGIWVILFLNLFLATSCQKFPEDDSVTLKRAKKRIEGTWQIKEYLIDGVDSLQLFLDSADLPYLTYRVDYKGSFKLGGGNYPNNGDFVPVGTLYQTYTFSGYKIEKDNFYIGFEFFDFKNEGLPYNARAGDWHVFKIKKLTEKEFIIEIVKKSKKLLRIKLIRIGD